MPPIIGPAGSITKCESPAWEMLVATGAHRDAARLVHRLYGRGSGAFDRIVTIFGPESVGEDGYIDRRSLRARVFGKLKQMSERTSAIGSISEAVNQVVDGWSAALGSDQVAPL